MRALAASLPPESTPQAVYDNLSDADAAVLAAARVVSVTIPGPIESPGARFLRRRVARARADAAARLSRLGKG
jgi:hypothetical protein